MKIITGETGVQHIHSEDVAEFNKGIVSTKNFVLNTGQKLSAQLLSNNIIRISGGDIMHAGRHSRILNYEDVQISNGSQGVNRTDVIVARYNKDVVTGIEDEKLVVIKGASGVPAVPLAGDMLLYTVTLTGVNITAISAKFSILIGVKELEELLISKETALKYTIDLNYLTLKNMADNNLAALNNLIKANSENAKGLSTLSSYVDRIAKKVGM